ncbi:hydroxyacylglutathione hydrolase [Chachezhania antarctica]|uniref:hydroxyacylglutathione hydrolase n=1 Tax=Chachezhania antarctica TaxID=2340860 RepID=UPI000EB2964A|nr:hydroxyacylglutathione hydrolase [Chachezhania antarctica]|tara:strand:- start:7 stop:777 length:771 start_codon:yes stop_codon:yes gene_type:complete
MPLDVVTVPCLQDNYAYLAHDPETGETAVIDLPEAAPLLAAAKEKGWSIDKILITHHHDDHIQGLDGVKEAFPDAMVFGHAKDSERLPPLDVALKDGDTVSIGGEEGTVMDVSGHTIGHIAFYFPGSKVAFTADSLMALGCGRVFEGTFPMMFESLSKLRSLPDDTVICSGHEYTQANAKFALSVEPDNAALQARAREIDAARASGTPTVPSLLSLEKATNPFLRAGTPELAAAIGMENANPVDIFAEVRTRKDNF